MRIHELGLRLLPLYHQKCSDWISYRTSEPHSRLSQMRWNRPSDVFSRRQDILTWVMILVSISLSPDYWLCLCFFSLPLYTCYCFPSVPLLYTFRLSSLHHLCWSHQPPSPTRSSC